jgi:hypothetical protein
MGRRARLHLRRRWRALSRLQQDRPAEHVAGLQGRRRQEGLAALSWDRVFDDPIILPDGRELVTLRDAGHHITALPKAAQRKPEWELATALLLSAAESGGIIMMAEIAMRRALGHGQPKPPPETLRKRPKRYRVIR